MIYKNIAFDVWNLIKFKTIKRLFGFHSLFYFFVGEC